MTALTRNPINTSLLQSTKFRLVFDRLPAVTYFCQTANLPGVSVTEIPRYTPFVELYHPGEKLMYDTFNITFLVDEDLRSWREIHDWMRGMTFPTNFDEYKNLARRFPGTNLPTFSKNIPAYSDGILTIYSNQNNPQFRVKLADMFPVNLGSLVFNVSDSAENTITSDATFRFSYYDIDLV